MTSIDSLRMRRVLGRAEWGVPTRFGPDGWLIRRADKSAAIIASCAEIGPGEVEWVHASISRPGRLPDYADLALMHRAVFGDGWAYQVFAPASDHINIHEYCLHLWGRLDGAMELPDFTYGTQSI